MLISIAPLFPPLQETFVALFRVTVAPPTEPTVSVAFPVQVFTSVTITEIAPADKPEAEVPDPEGVQA